MAKKKTDIPEMEKALTAKVGKGQGASDSGKKRAQTLTDILLKYQEGKRLHDQRIVENDRWYRSQQWSIMRKQANKGEPEPTSAYLWNTVANRHGDLMDAFPEPVFVEREQSDEQEAKTLSKIVKVVLERQKFHSVYSRNAWYKIKAGTSCYGTFWDQSLENGVGDIAVRKIDVLRIFWQPGIEDVEDSPYLFILSLEDTEKVRKLYPDYAEDISESKELTYETYEETDTLDTTGMTMVIDSYRKEWQPDGKTILHLDKICSGVIVDRSVWKEGGEKGLYTHGCYPVTFDVMFPEEHSILGFGLVDVIKSPQMYIDKLDQILTRNAMVAGKFRYLVKKSGGINVEDLMDLSKDVVQCEGNVREGEDYAALQASALPASVVAHRDAKIAELKEVSGANDFNRGSAGNGVTAASAIMALQEAGNKLSRAMVTGTYEAYARICYLIMELIAQHYDDPRKFRITNEEGETEYTSYSNAGLQPQPIITGNEVVDAMPDQQMRKPILDVSVHAEKHSPYAALAQNEMAKELFAAGMFSPEMAPAAIIALNMMSFDGKDKIVAAVQKGYADAVAMQNAQIEAQKETAQDQEIVQKMNQVIMGLGGGDMLRGANITAGGAQQPQQGQQPQQQAQVAPKAAQPQRIQTGGM
jgi:hypothetical protein